MDQKNNHNNHKRKKINSWIVGWSKKFGPGLITGAADDDPSGIVTYSNIGAQFHYSLIWLAAYCYPLMVAIQQICAKVGWVTGQGLSTLIKRKFSEKIYFPLIFIFIIINIVNIGADLLAMGNVGSLIFPLSSKFLMFFFALIIIILEVFIPYKTYSKFLRYLCLILLAYPLSAILAQPSWIETIKSILIPVFHWKVGYLLAIIAFLGTTISPYLFFWQSDEEVEEEIDKGKISQFGQKPKRVKKKEIRKIGLDTRLGMLASEIVTIFIIIAAGRILFEKGIYHIETARQAALVLSPLIGQQAMVLFGLGIIGTGLLAIPVLAGASAYAFAEAFNKREGLYLKLGEAKSFYGIIILSIIIALFANFIKVSSMTLLYWTAILNGLITPFILVCLMKISNDKKIMGRHTNSPLTNFLGWLTTGAMFSAIIGFIIIKLFNKI